MTFTTPPMASAPCLDFRRRDDDRLGMFHFRRLLHLLRRCRAHREREGDHGHHRPDHAPLLFCERVGRLSPGRFPDSWIDATAHAFPSPADGNSGSRSRGTWTALPTHSGATVPASHRLPSHPERVLTGTASASPPLVRELDDRASARALVHRDVTAEHAFQQTLLEDVDGGADSRDLAKVCWKACSAVTSRWTR